MRIAPLLSLSSVLLLFVVLYTRVPQSESLYPYAIRGFVTDLRHKPLLFVGGWLLKKAIILKLLKIKLKLKKKFIIKKIIKKILFKFLIGRKKRSIEGGFGGDESPGEFQFPPEPQDNEINNYFQMSRELDTEGCIARGICQVLAGGNATHTNSDFDATILEFYSNKDLTRIDPNSPEYLYDYAAYIGRTRNLEECSREFPNCREQPRVLNKFMEMSFETEKEICDGPVGGFSGDDLVGLSPEHAFAGGDGQPSNFNANQRQGFDGFNPSISLSHQPSPSFTNTHFPQQNINSQNFNQHNPSSLQANPQRKGSGSIRFES